MYRGWSDRLTRAVAGHCAGAGPADGFPGPGDSADHGGGTPIYTSPLPRARGFWPTRLPQLEVGQDPTAIEKYADNKRLMKFYEKYIKLASAHFAKPK